MSNVGKRLTAKEATFAQRFAATGDRAYAAEKAGYVQPHAAASQLMRRDDVRQAVAIEVHKRLDALVVTTLDVFAKILDDDKAPNKDKIAVGKVVLTGWRSSEAGADGSKEPSEMSGEDLRARIARLQSELAERARPVLELEAGEPDQAGDLYE